VGQNVDAFTETMMNDIGTSPKRFKFSMVEDVMGDIVGYY
jgi:hypothetical protein